jgi:2,3-bisphosphoglycerate-independent phosphoglycerate mutase
VVELLLILDGASEPPGGETSLGLARTPTLDRLAETGTTTLLRLVPPGLPVGSETAIPALLGWRPTGPVDRGALEAAAIGIEPASGERAWRVDVRAENGERVGEADALRAATALGERLSRHRVRHLRGHRLLLTGPPPLPDAAAGPGLHPWPEGVVPPRMLGAETVAIAAAGAAAGAARLLGAAVVIPPSATGDTDTDLVAKADAAEGAVAAGASRVVVHVGGADEAAHRRDRAAKVSFLERVDRELLAPLVRTARDAGAILRVGPDHGCDPRTGAHDPSPAPWLSWPRVDDLMSHFPPDTGRKCDINAGVAL